MLAFSSSSFSALQSKVGYASQKQNKKTCSYTRHLHMSSLYCDSKCFHLLKHGNSVWSQFLKRTAPETDCATLPLAQEVLSPRLHHWSWTFSDFFFCWYFRHYSFTYTGLILLWLLHFFYIYVRDLNTFFPVVGEVSFCYGRDLKYCDCFSGPQTTWLQICMGFALCQWDSSCGIPVLIPLREKHKY